MSQTLRLFLFCCIFIVFASVAYAEPQMKLSNLGTHYRASTIFVGGEITWPSDETYALSADDRIHVRVLGGRSFPDDCHITFTLVGPENGQSIAEAVLFIQAEKSGAEPKKMIWDRAPWSRDTKFNIMMTVDFSPQIIPPVGYDNLVALLAVGYETKSGHTLWNQLPLTANSMFAQSVSFISKCKHQHYWECTETQYTLILSDLQATVDGIRYGIIGSSSLPLDKDTVLQCYVNDDKVMGSIEYHKDNNLSYHHLNYKFIIGRDYIVRCPYIMLSTPKDVSQNNTIIEITGYTRPIPNVFEYTNVTGLRVVYEP